MDGRLVDPEMSWPRRSIGCGEVTEAAAGQRCSICGWVERYRNHGGVLFVDVRDHTGIVQARP